MKQFFNAAKISGVMIMLSVALSSCISTKMARAINAHYYKYTFALRERTARKAQCTFSNSDFSIAFEPQFIRVSYTVTNFSTAPVKILWDKTYLVVHNDSSKIIPSTIAPADADITPPPAEIQAGQSLQGFITPIDYIKNTGQSWVATEFYPSHDDSLAPVTDWIMGLIGVDIFKLYIPIVSGGQTKTYKFTFYPAEMEKSVTSQVPKE